ncbi:MAG TPA: transposase [Ktedonobacterales bacterium]|jgi:IS605 OrfB family transposase
MQLAEQHVIARHDPRFALIDETSFAAKNLYNAGLYLVRQSFIWENRYLDYQAVYHQMKHHEAYRALPTKVAQQVLRLLDANWKAYFAACQAYRDDPSKFVGRPKMPHYKDKTDGRQVLIYTTQALATAALRRGEICPSKLSITIQTKQTRIAQVRIVPQPGFYVVEVVYHHTEAAPSGDPTLYAAVDLGVDVLAALTSNKKGFVPVLVNGRPLKSTNQFYNKRRAELQEALGHPGRTRRMERLTTRRNWRVQHYLHTASRSVIDVLLQEGIGTLIVGKNLLWKQEVNLGKVNNQHFVQIPHARFIDLLTYKAQLAGIAVIVQEESYTSQASFLDLDPLPVYDPANPQQYEFSGKRVQRGLYQAKDGRTLHADVNGSYNTLRKAIPDAFGKGIEAPVVAPVQVTVGVVSPTRGVGRQPHSTN